MLKGLALPDSSSDPAMPGNEADDLSLPGVGSGNPSPLYNTTYKLLADLGEISPTALKIVGQVASMANGVLSPLGEEAQWLDENLVPSTALGIQDALSGNFLTPEGFTLLREELAQMTMAQKLGYYTGIGIGAVPALEMAAVDKVLQGRGALLGNLVTKFGLFRGGMENAPVLTKGKITNYLSNIQSVSKEQFLSDIRSIGLKFKGQSQDGKFMEYMDRNGNVRVKVHPPDNVTQYDHIHIYDKYSNPLNTNLEVVSQRSPEAHIEVKFNEPNNKLTPTI